MRKDALIAQEIIRRLKKIRQTKTYRYVSAGATATTPAEYEEASYYTDAGKNVFHGQVGVSDERLPALVLFEDEDMLSYAEGSVSSSQHGTTIQGYLPYRIEGHIVDNFEAPNLEGHKLICDIKAALFEGDIKLDGAASDDMIYIGRVFNPRADGANIVTVTVRIRVPFVDDLLRPVCCDT